ncbi:GIY-YIG nuclease family protein [Candidatus Binatia bacterium]|nr:GIY-YIG nuclease family protein [Candidatus Binatia bacterium]
MSFWVYLLRCADGSFYVGHTDNLEQRMEQHRSGELGGYTSTRRPVDLVYSEEFSTRDEAFAAERQIKGWSRKKKEALIRGDWEEIKRLARGRSRERHPSTSSG